MTDVVAAADGTSEELKRLRLVWIAFLAAVVTYAPLPWLIISEGSDTAPPPPPGIHSALNFAALGAGVSSYVARRWWTNSLRAALESPAGVGAGPWTRLRTGCLITWTLSEAVAVLGLALALMARQPLEGVAPAAAAIVLLFVHRPAVWPLEAVAKAQGSSG